MRRLNLIWIVFSALAGYAFAGDKIPHPFVDKQIGNIIIGKSTTEGIVRIYGRGLSVSSYHGEVMCYYNAIDSSFLKIFFHDNIVEGISLSAIDEDKSVEDCKKHRIEIKNVVTGKGIGIGDSLEEIVEIYGKSNRMEIKAGILIYEYHTDFENDPQVNLFYDAYLFFEAERLIKLIIHDGE